MRQNNLRRSIVRQTGHENSSGERDLWTRTASGSCASSRKPLATHISTRSLSCASAGAGLPKANVLQAAAILDAAESASDVDEVLAGLIGLHLARINTKSCKEDNDSSPPSSAGHLPAVRGTTTKSSILQDIDLLTGSLAALYGADQPAAVNNASSISSHLDMEHDPGEWPAFLQLLDSTCLQAGVVPAASKAEQDDDDGNGSFAVEDEPAKRKKGCRRRWLGWVALATAGMVAGALAAGRSRSR